MKILNLRKIQIKELQEIHKFNLNKFKIKSDKRQILRNCVNAELGLHILNCSLKDNFLF